MACHRSSRCSRLGAALVFALLACVLCSLLVVPPVARSAESSRARFERADAKAIRAETRDILAERRFAPPKERRETWLERLLDKLASLFRPRFSGTLGRIFWWVLVVFCVLTLLAVVAHLVWNLVTYVRGAHLPARGVKGLHFDRVGDRSFEELRQLMLEHAQKGEFREAIGMMMAALLRWLDDAGIFTLHQSKTNGDYVREYPKERRSRDEFRHFARGFDGRIYGGAACDRAGYVQMNEAFERVLDHAARET